jgi:hypothetical protein
MLGSYHARARIYNVSSWILVHCPISEYRRTAAHPALAAPAASHQPLVFRLLPTTRRLPSCHIAQRRERPDAQIICSCRYDNPLPPKPSPNLPIQAASRDPDREHAVEHATCSAISGNVFHPAYSLVRCVDTRSAPTANANCLAIANSHALCCLSLSGLFSLSLSLSP